MTRVLASLFVVAVLTVPLISSGDPPSPSRRGSTPTEPVSSTELPVGQWHVEFANGVVQACEIKSDGSATVFEPLRTAAGKATARAGAFVIVFEDDRIERWTPVGRQLVVEHWSPGSQLPVVTPFLGIADRGH